MSRLREVQLSTTHEIDLIEAARDVSPIAGLTHNFYRYPARFSPRLVRSVIRSFTAPGELVLDPFVGGGTTLVEALASGRHAVGTDISSLATFVSKVKTTVYYEHELRRLSQWSEQVGEDINLSRQEDSAGIDSAYTRHLDSPDTWRLRKAIAQSIGSAKSLGSARLEMFGRCAVLNTAQWALDRRKNLPAVDDFRICLARNVLRMVDGARELRFAVESTSETRPDIECINCRTSEITTRNVLKGSASPRLVVTSPPYPGVHVLYHRWQVSGGRETAAPFWITDRSDGDGAAYYTMGARNSRQLNSYFENLRESLNALASVCEPNTTIVQVVAFSNPAWQLPRYLSVADDAGLEELVLPSLAGVGDGRLWRTVPNRKWYADQRGTTNGSREVVLLHQLRG